MGSWLSNRSGRGGGRGILRRERYSDTNIMLWYSSGVVLPTGEVVALSGADKDEVVEPGLENAIRRAELWDPATEKGSPLAAGVRDRTYQTAPYFFPTAAFW